MICSPPCKIVRMYGFSLRLLVCHTHPYDYASGLVKFVSWFSQQSQGRMYNNCSHTHMQWQYCHIMLCPQEFTKNILWHPLDHTPALKFRMVPGSNLLDPPQLQTELNEKYRYVIQLPVWTFGLGLGQQPLHQLYYWHSPCPMMLWTHATPSHGSAVSWCIPCTHRKYRWYGQLICRPIAAPQSAHQCHRVVACQLTMLRSCCFL